MTLPLRTTRINDSGIMDAQDATRIRYGACTESELFTGDTSKDNHSPGPVIRGVSP